MSRQIGDTLRAHWTENTATLTYDANGHGTAPDAVTMKTSEATSAATAITGVTGYTFTGWNTKVDGTGTSYAAGAQVKAANVNPTATTLYAQWTEHTTRCGITAGWQEWTSTDSLPTNGGHYYLTKDVTVSSTWTVPSGATYLDLNGHTVQRSSVGTLVEINNGSVFELYDESSAQYRFKRVEYNIDGRFYWARDNSGEYSLTGGCLLGNDLFSAADAGLVNVFGGTFRMHGGNIVGVCNTDYWGYGGVFIGTNGTFDMSGGTIAGCYARCGGGLGANHGNNPGQADVLISGDAAITYCSAEHGGGMFIRSGVVLKMTGGSITHCYASGHGGGINWKGTKGAYFLGGEITQNSAQDCGGGIGNEVNDTFVFGGAMKVYENTAKGQTDNYYPMVVCPLVIGTGENAPREGMNVGIKLSTGTGIFSEAAANKDDVQYFHSDNANYAVMRDPSSGKLKIDTPIKYTIAYNANGGTEAPASGTATYDQSYTLSSDAPTREGYTFNGWNTAQDGTGTTYQPSASVSDLSSTNGATVTLYAQWTANEYTILFDANGGENAPESMTATYDVAAKLSDDIPTKDGYTFMGWSTEQDGEAIYSAGASVMYLAESGTVTLYAQWEQIMYAQIGEDDEEYMQQFATLEEAIDYAVELGATVENEVIIKLLYTDGEALQLEDSIELPFGVAIDTSEREIYEYFNYLTAPEVDGFATGVLSTENGILRAKKMIQVPSGEEVQYTGYSIIGIPENDAYTITGDTATGVGEYTATLTLKVDEGYAWATDDDDRFGEKTVTWKIVQAENYIEGEVTLGEDGVPTLEGVTALFGEPVLVYYTDAGCTEEATEPLADGTYYVCAEVAETDNYGFAASAAVEYVKSTPVYVAQIGETECETLADAFAAAEENDTITLLADCTTDKAILIDKSVTLDLGEYNITAANDWEFVSGNGNAMFSVRRGATLTIKGNGTISTNGANTDSLYAAIGLTVKADGASGANAGVVINGGTIEGYYYGITGNGSRGNTSIEVNGGTITATAPDSNLGIFNPQGESVVTIINGTITGLDSAIEMRGGELYVNGGTLTSTADEYSVTANGSGSTTVGAAIAVAQHTHKGDIVVGIKGGSLNGKYALSVADPQENNSDNVDVILSSSADYNGTVGGIVIADNTKVNIGRTDKTIDVAAPAGYLWKDADQDSLSDAMKNAAVIQLLTSHSHSFTKYSPIDDKTHQAICSDKDCSETGAITDHVYEAVTVEKEVETEKGEKVKVNETVYRCAQCGHEQEVSSGYAVYGYNIHDAYFNYYPEDPDIAEAEHCQYTHPELVDSGASNLTANYVYNGIAELKTDATYTESDDEVITTYAFKHWAVYDTEKKQATEQILSTALSYKFIVKESVNIIAVYEKVSEVSKGTNSVQIDSVTADCVSKTKNYLNIQASFQTQTGASASAQNFKFVTGTQLATANVEAENVDAVLKYIKEKGTTPSGMSVKLDNDKGIFTASYPVGKNITETIYILPYITVDSTDVYATEATAVRLADLAAPQISISQIGKADASATKGYVTFTSSRSTPKCYEVVETGILYNTNSGLGYKTDNATDLTNLNDWGAEKVKNTVISKAKKTAATNTALNGTFTLKVNIGNPSNNGDFYVYAVPYVIVRDGNGNTTTIYGELAYRTYNN